MARLPVRCKKYSVGKEIGGAVYVHRMYERLLPPCIRISSEHLPDGFDYTVIKFVEKFSCVSFVLCPDFDTADEPVVGDVVRVDLNGSTKLFPQQKDPFIYHHKWLFVMDDYKGFDVENSRSRSISWLRLHDIDTKRIGRKNFWNTHVLPRLSPNGCNWLSSAEASAALRLSSCELMHFRQTGQLKFVKLGNAYFYDIASLTR